MLLSCNVIPKDGMQIPVISPVTGKYIETFTKIKLSEAEFLKCQAYGTILVGKRDVSALTFEEAIEVANQTTSKAKKKEEVNSIPLNVTAKYTPGEPPATTKETTGKPIVDEPSKDVSEQSNDTLVENGSYTKETETKQDNNSVEENNSPTNDTVSTTVSDNRLNASVAKKKDKKINNIVKS